MDGMGERRAGAVGTLRIGAPRVVCGEGRARLVAEVRVAGATREVWFEVEEAYGCYLCAERADAFLVGLLPNAQREGWDIVCEAPVTEELLYQLRDYLVPALARNGHALYATRIEATPAAEPLPCAGGVGTGISCGVDSLHVVKRRAHAPCPGLSLTHLLVCDVGAFEEDAGQFAWQAGHARRFAEEAGLALIVGRSNLRKAFYIPHWLSCTYSNAFAVLALRKLWKAYYCASSGEELSSTFTLKDNDLHDVDRYDLLSLDCFSIPSLRFYLEGCTQTRLEKTRELADWPPAWKYLHVCCADRGPNCGMCAKCVRTQTTLDALGALRKFGQAFDVDAYYARRKKNLTWLAIQHFSPKGDILSEEVYQAMRAQIPLSVKIAACFRAFRRRFRRER